MPNTPVPAAAIGLPNRRLFLAAGSAGAVFGVLSHAVAAPAVSPELVALIEAHRQAEDALTVALKREDEASERFKAACEIFDFDGVAFNIHNPERSRRFLLDLLETEKQREFRLLKMGSSAAMRGRLDEIFEELRRDKVEHFEAVLSKVDDLRESMGLTAADEVSSKAMSVADDILLKICAFPCASADEIRAKAEYLFERPDDVEGKFLEALLRSLASASVAEA